MLHGGRVSGIDSRSDLLGRPRLAAVLAERHQRRVTVITAGAGFGKTSLLAQTLAGRDAAGDVVDVYVRVDRDDGAATIMRSCVEGLHPDRGAGAVSVPELVDLIRHAAPRNITLVLDDTHRLDPANSAWASIGELVESMPFNGHLIISGRTAPNVSLARLAVTGDALELDEGDLAFTEAELVAFARARNVDRKVLGDHGWPALTEVAAKSGNTGVERFVVEEILDGIEPDRLAALERVALAEAVDDRVVAAMTSYQGSAVSLTRGLPLATPTESGAIRLHDLWRELLSARLSPEDRDEATSALGHERLAGGELLAAQRAFSRANDLVGQRRVLRELVRDHEFAHSIDERASILSSSSSELESTAEWSILVADLEVTGDPSRALPWVRRAVVAAQEAGDAELTALALLRVGELVFRSADHDLIVAARDDVVALDDAEPAVSAVAALLDVWVLMTDNQSAKALEIFDSSAIRSYAPLAGLASFYYAVQFAWSGHCDHTMELVDSTSLQPGGRAAQRLGGLIATLKWFTGRLTERDRAATVELVDRIERAGQVHLFVEGAATTALFYASAGEVAVARDLVDRAMSFRGRMTDRSWGSTVADYAAAIIDLMDGDEPMAIARLSEAIPETGPFLGFGRHISANVAAAMYALVPRARPYFDDEEVGPDFEVATNVGRALVDLRAGDSAAACRLPWNELGRLRTWAYEPHLAELALAASGAGVDGAGPALDSLVHNPRGVLRSIAERYGDTAIGTAALNRLKVTPARPSSSLRIGVLGPLTLSTGDDDLSELAQFRRQLVRDLLMLLVDKRRVRRVELSAALWPEANAKAADENLRATLCHLRALIEPDDADAPPWYVRNDGDYIVLFDNELLDVDVDRFRRLIELGRAADAQRRPVDALGHFVAAVEMVRGDYLIDCSVDEAGEAARTTLHLDFVAAATRASELLVVVGENAEACRLARRAVEVEPLAEPAHRALIRGLAASDRAGARRAFDRALGLLADEGLTAEPATLALAAELSLGDTAT